MLRLALLSVATAATLAGCASDYAYRNDAGGDYYYSQPSIQYRNHAPYGYYGVYGGYAGYGPAMPGFHLDPFGRPVYVDPYGYYGYYGYPYGYGWYPSRPAPDPDDDDDTANHESGGGNGNGSHVGDGTSVQPAHLPPWRTSGRPWALPRTAYEEQADVVRRQPRAQVRPRQAPAMPRQIQPTSLPPPPRMQRESGFGATRAPGLPMHRKATRARDED